MKKLKICATIALTIGLLFSVTGCAKKEVAAQAAQKKVVPVEVMKLSTSTVTEEYDSFGKTYPLEETNVAAKTKGEIKNIYFNVGDQVNKGDIIYTVDSDTLVNNCDIKISSLEKSVKDSEIKYNDAFRDYNNMKILYENKTVSKNDLDNAQSQLDQIALSLDQSRKDLELNKRDKELSIGNTIVKSPISGIVAEKNVEVGEMAGNADFKIVNLKKMNVKVNVAENVVNRMNVGDPVDVYIESLNENYNGTIISISPVGTGNNATYPVEVEVTNKDSKIRSGMFAKANFKIANLNDQIQVPKKSILKAQDEDYVYVVDTKTNMPKKIVVEKGIVNNGLVQVKNGLKAGDQLVVKGQEYVDEKSEVKIIN
ncbi:efflux RND transporter periplasmic adaptor subunit [Marinisporobacter balticus]|uniref:RND family efflux transporter MFP subunit n=1 Tax=Marinisporobacter balticus TaxID=2018667 RepID=A0A4R2KR99_9FIRM|nr:efflux RND transporter periplasmic adaptor subunit [Marinisporobacter balticus]TCO72658.1 RND family efflux transporter MFP subunit [Marinisporobacter balticus]